MIGSWLTLIFTGIGRGNGTGAKPNPGGDSKAAAMSNLTNFLASSSWTPPQWQCWANRDTLNTMANRMLDRCFDFIFFDDYDDDLIEGVQYDLTFV